MLILRMLLSPFTPIYAFIIWLRNFLFNKSVFDQTKVNSKVISIGNITMGGAGKTPTTIYVTNLLKNNNRKVGVLSRGYGRKSKGYLLVADENGIKTDVNTSGDEIYLTALECKVPAAVCEKRVEGAKKFLKDVTLDSIVLDDAFQHRWIYRDLNLLIFDQTFLNKFGGVDQNLLPLGIMRESFSAIKRADAVIINRKFSGLTNIPIKLQSYFNDVKVFTAKYKATGFYDVKNRDFFPLNEFHGQKSLVISGIARPHSFINILHQNNIDVNDKLIFTDHKNYTQEDIQKIRKEFYARNSHSVITTEKDAVKLSGFSKELDDIDIYYLKIEMIFDEADVFEKFVLSKI